MFVKVKNILYITCIPKDFGGKSNGGVATHSWQLINRSLKSYKVGLYCDIKEVKIKEIKLHRFSNSRILKIIFAIYGFFIADKQILRKMDNILTLKDKINVLYHFVILRKISKLYDVIHVH